MFVKNLILKNFTDCSLPPQAVNKKEKENIIGLNFEQAASVARSRVMAVGYKTKLKMGVVYFNLFNLLVF